MSTTNSVANGAQLDDCHSSIYSLADLTGLRWRTFSATLTLAASPCDDPVLVAFSRCLSQDILAVWRRAPNVKKCSSLQTQLPQYQEDDFHGAPSLELKKELWIFWWGNEPSVENVGRINGLTAEPEGSWEEQGLSYECRTLLFKAIHNLVERCLQSDNFVRIGKWFLRPANREKDTDKNARLSCSFSFFLRGEVTVCTTVEIAQHQPVEILNNQHLQYFVNNNVPRNVILSPYGLRATMTGVAYKSPHELTVKKVIDEWKHFYPLQPINQEADYDELNFNDVPVPPVVEVSVAGVRMNYPSAYVLLPVSEAESKIPNSYASTDRSERKAADCNYHHLGLPSVGSILDSIKSATSEAVSCTVSETVGGDDQQDGSQAVSRAETFSALILNLISRVVNRHHYSHFSSSDSFQNAVNSEMNSCSHPPESTWHWSTSNSPFKNVRQRKNFHPPNDEENSQIGKARYLGDNQIHEGRRKAEKQRQPLSMPFHHGNSVTISDSTNQAIDTFNRPSYNDGINCNQQSIGGVGLPLYCINPEEAPKILHNELSETMFHNDKLTIASGGLGTVPNVCNEMGIHRVQNQYLHTSLDTNLMYSSIVEIKEYISLWKKMKLPAYKESTTNQLQPTVSLGSLDSESGTPGAFRMSKRPRTSICGMQESAWSAMSIKRRKLEEEVEAGGVTEGPSGDGIIGRDVSGDVLTRHVTVGAVTGELAGMTVLSDPYEFEEDEKDNSFAGSFNASCAQDISLKQVASGIWSADNSGDNNMQTQELSHLEDLLKQGHRSTEIPDAFPLSVASGALEVNSTTKLPTTLTDKNDLKVSECDLDHMFNESEDDDNVGIFTPAEENYGDGTMAHSDNCELTANLSQPGKYGGFQRRLATPFFDTGQTFSSEGKPVNSMKKNPALNTGSLHPMNIGSVEDRSVVGNFGREIPGKVYTKTPLCVQPLSDKYLPVGDLEEKLPQLCMYTPSWQVHLECNQQNIMPSIVVEDVNFMHTTKSSMQVMNDNDANQLPQLPSYVVNTPVSVVPQQSPANLSSTTPRTPRTPRGGNENAIPASPASSVLTPATAGRTQAQLTPLNSIPSSAPPSDISSCRASALYVNLMLSDSVLNLFRDISFDQCAMCVCNDNISSRDVDLGYLPSMADNLSEGQYPCTCGFSAVRNRCLSVGAGLFLEDELDIVGKELEDEIMKMRQLNYKCSDDTLENIVGYAVKQSSNPYAREKNEVLSATQFHGDNIASRLDVMEACLEAINGGISVMEIGNQPKIKLHNCKNVIHHWSSTRVYDKSNSADSYEMLQYLKPVLQNAIQKLRSERSFNYIQRVNGPLTWREFCKDNSYALEPLPVPMLLVGQNHDWMTVSPFALDYWEKLYLEPYAGMTNISYIVICPDLGHLFIAAKSFFHELNSIYEQCRLGTHRPFSRNVKDNGIFCIGNDIPSLSELPEWCKKLDKTGENEDTNSGHETSSESIKLYACACSQILYPLFNIADSQLSSKQPYSGSPQKRMGTNNPVGKQGSARQTTNLPSNKPWKDFSQGQFASRSSINESETILIYFINPFATECFSSFSFAIWNCYMDLIRSLPESMKNSVVIQLIPSEDILQYSGPKNESDVRTIRSLAFNSYFQCRRMISHNTTVRTMTAFGPAATKNEAVKINLSRLALPSLHSPAYILANSRNLRKDSILGQSNDKCNILFVAYCLSHDQKWLLASATDQDGEMLETFCINIDVLPKRVSLRRKQRVCVKSAAIQKLWKLCFAAITQTASTLWRVVIGRLGRLGHGEIQEWSKHLNRRTLSTLSKQMTSKCNQCMINGAFKNPRIFSACLTSLEPEGSFTILPDFVKLAPFGRTVPSGTQLQLKTPEDASCTHIYVFPTSSLVQTAGETFQSGNMDFLPEELDFPMPEFGEQDDLTIIEAVNDLFQPSASPTTHHQTTDDIGGHAKTSTANDGVGEDPLPLQQPLALGYLVSTAPTGPLPDTFWISCPHARLKCPVFLRFALHIRVSCDEVHNTASADLTEHHHQLDSAKTAQVLRYVMENYNALSWLTCDPVSRDRRSCLPLHYLVLARLYQSLKELT